MFGLGDTFNAELMAFLRGIAQTWDLGFRQVLDSYFEKEIGGRVLLIACSGRKCC